MKILMSSDTYFPRITGVASAIKNLRNGLDMKGIISLLIAPTYPENDNRFSMYNEDDDLIVRIPSFPSIIDGETKLMSPLSRKKVGEVINYFNPDVLHIQTEFMALYLVRKFAEQNGIPLVGSFRTNFWYYAQMYILNIPLLGDENRNRIINSFLRRRYENFVSIVALTRSFKKKIIENKIHSNVYVIPSSLSSIEFYPDEYERLKCRRQFFQDNPELKNKNLLIYVSRLSKEKNIPFLIDCVEELKKRYPDIKLFLIGDGPLKSQIKTLSERKGLSENVILTGYLHKSEIKKYLCAGNVFVTASQSETMGNSVVEAMSCRLPVVALNSSGIGDVLENEKGGFLVDNLTDYTNNVIKLIEHPNLHHNKSVSAYQRSLDFTDIAVADKFAEVYKEAAASKKPVAHFPVSKPKDDLEVASSR